MNTTRRYQHAQKILFAGALLALLSLPALASADIRIEKLESVDTRQDFVVGPAKTELTLNPGQSQSVDLIVTNRTGEDRRFNLDVEDITGSRSTEQVVTLLGNERGPYSLKDYLHFESTSFVLKPGERAWVPVTVSIPTDAEAGGKYGSVIVSTTGTTTAGEIGAGGAVLISRVGALFFVTVPGDVKKEGRLKSFAIADGTTLRGEGPMKFNILYENNGNIHLNPSGMITVTNLFGQKVAAIELGSWFSLPNSLRLREVDWDAPFLMGRYVATLDLGLGYDNKADSASVVFYVIPWLLLVSIAVILLLVILFLRWVISRFEIRRRS